MQRTREDQLCAVLLRVDTGDTPAASTTRKRANPPRSIRTRVCLELGNLADEQRLQCPVPPSSSSSVLWCRPSHSSQSCINPFFSLPGGPPFTLYYLTLHRRDDDPTASHPSGAFKQLKTTPCWGRSTAIPISSRPSQVAIFIGNINTICLQQARAACPAKPRAVKDATPLCSPAARAPSCA